MKNKMLSFFAFSVYLIFMYSTVVRLPTDQKTSSVRTQASVNDILLYEDEHFLLDSEGWESTDCSTVTVTDNILTAVSAGSTKIIRGDQAVSVKIAPRSSSVRKVYKLTVYKATQSVVVYAADSSGNYTVPVKVMTCSTGTADSETPTETYTVKSHFRWKLLYGPCYGQYCTSFSPSYLFHSLPYSKKNASTVYDYEFLGQKASHGCIRLSVRDAKWIYDNCAVGSKVEITESAGLKGPVPVSQINEEKFNGWDPTDPDPDNPYIISGLSHTPIVYTGIKRLVMFAGETVSLPLISTGDVISISSTDERVAVCNEDFTVNALASGSCTIYFISGDGGDCSLDIIVQ